MTIHDPTTIAPARFTASVVVEAVCDYLCEQPFDGDEFQRVFESTLKACDDDAPAVFTELAQALEAEGYFAEPHWDGKHAMIDLVQRVVARLRS